MLTNIQGITRIGGGGRGGECELLELEQYDDFG